MTIRRKLVTIIMLTGMIVVIPAMISFGWIMNIVVQKMMVRNLTADAEMIAEACNVALAFQGHDDATNILKTLRTKKTIVFAAVYDMKGSQFANYFRDGKTPSVVPSILKEGKYEIDSAYITVFRPIVLDKEKIGTLCLRSDLSPLKELKRANLIIVCLFLLATMLLSYLLAVRFQLIISRPILHLAQTAEKVSGQKDYSHRATIFSSDEMGYCAEAFNQMLEQIQHQDSLLRNANDELENRVQIRTSELEKAKVKAEIANRIKSDFLANMSHEIRTPMNAVIGFADVLAEENLTQDQKNYVHSIRSSASNLMIIINDILDFSKIEAGKMTIETLRTDLPKLLDSLQKMMKFEAQKKNLDFAITLSPSVPKQIHTDPVRLNQCLLNLINNAIKFTPKGRVYVRIDTEQAGDRQFVTFHVEDTGIGIPQETLKHIFNSFTQADGSTTRKYGGTGLGLSITKRLAELLGGQLICKSKSNEGSVFSLSIPTNGSRKSDSDTTDMPHRVSFSV